MSNPLAQEPLPGTRRAVTGLVTKLVGDGATYGFINDEIFFQQINVTGGPASVGDQVYADCEFSPNLPIKWNAVTVNITVKTRPSVGQPPQPVAVSQPQVLPQDPRQHSQLHQSSAQPAAPVAVTYQQHRQQRMQQQQQQLGTDSEKQDPKPSLLPQTGQPRLLDGQQGDFFNSGQQQAPPVVTGGANIAPFQDQPPMGPPKFTYTSQLGSAFVTSNQFVPPPFLIQQQHQPPPMLPQPPQAPIQQQPLLTPQNNQRQNKQTNRFNNQNDKPDNRNNNRRGGGPNRGSSRDRDGSGNRSMDSSQSRDRSAGRQQHNNQYQGGGNKRDDIPVRPSPPPHSSARSSTSVSSDRGGPSSKSSRKHYDVQNVPKTLVMSNMNSSNMKLRCPAAVHVPSDLKEVIVNKYFRLDIRNIPKPIKFEIEKQDQTEANVAEADTSMTSEQRQPDQMSEASNLNENIKKEGDATTDSNQTPPTSKSDLKLNHKYGVKVILMSLPELNSIYNQVLGSDQNSTIDLTSGSKPSNKRVEETVSLLCNKGANNGHSLISGKFDPVLDGFVEGVQNEFERHNRQPDLIAACKRIVQEQIGLDLGPCKSWTLLSTFVYNNRSDYFSTKASVEYSYIYVPHIWTMVGDEVSIKQVEMVNEESGTEDTPMAKEDQSVEPALVEQEKVEESTDQQDADVSMETKTTDLSANEQLATDECATVTLETIGELKVANLKLELDKREVKYKPNAKKAELVSLLRQCLIESSQPSSDVGTSEPEQPDVGIMVTEDNNEEASQDVSQADQLQAHEPILAPAEEVGSNLPTESEKIEEKSEESVAAVNGSNKRKESDIDETNTQNKKVCTEPSNNKNVEPVQLIRTSFVVKAKGEQQLSLVSLYEVSSQIGRHDQFELSVASNILKESLIIHFSEYILTTLIEDYRQKNPTTTTAGKQNLVTSSQESASSDSNNNPTSAKQQQPSKSPSSSSMSNPLKELPKERYINLAFTLFDASQAGYVYFEDLNKLFNNTGLTLSKRALITLIGDSEKFYYKSLPDLSPRLSPTYQYEFPEQFYRLLGLSARTSDSAQEQSNCRLISFKGVTYDVEKLVAQVREAETMRVSLHERFNFAIANSDKQAEEIHVLEVNQKSLAKAIKAQNDEIVELKRERDALKKKVDGLRKGVKGAVTLLSDLVKEDK